MIGRKTVTADSYMISVITIKIDEVNLMPLYCILWLAVMS